MGVAAVTGPKTHVHEGAVSNTQQMDSITAQRQGSQVVAVDIKGDLTGPLEAEQGPGEGQESKWGASWMEQVREFGKILITAKQEVSVGARAGVQVVDRLIIIHDQ
jgi:hypothetical protein